MIFGIHCPDWNLSNLARKYTKLHQGSCSKMTDLDPQVPQHLPPYMLPVQGMSGNAASAPRRPPLMTGAKIALHTPCTQPSALRRAGGRWGPPRGPDSARRTPPIRALPGWSTCPPHRRQSAAGTGIQPVFRNWGPDSRHRPRAEPRNCCGGQSSGPARSNSDRRARLRPASVEIGRAHV